MQIVANGVAAVALADESTPRLSSTLSIAKTSDTRQAISVFAAAAAARDDGPVANLRCIAAPARNAPADSLWLDGCHFLISFLSVPPPLL